MHVAARLKACTVTTNGAGCVTHMLQMADLYRVSYIHAVCYLEQRYVFIHLLL